MPEYMLAYHPGGKMPESPEEGAKLQQKWKDWIKGLGDAVVNPGTPLMHSRTVSADEVVENGGPNPLMGFTVVRAESIDAAVEIAKESPHLLIGTIEVAEMGQMKM